MRTVAELERKLTEPSPELIADISRLDGDIMILGVGGKMGPSLACLAKRAIEEAGVQKKVIGVARFSNPHVKDALNSQGIEAITADLMEESVLERLPQAANIIYMVGNKFGTTGKEYFTWVMNSYLPGRVAERFKDSRIVVFSTGNVYPLTPVGQGGASEEHPVGPVGEYAQSCLGRERVFEYFSRKNGTPMVFFRLNYAIDMRYGVLLEIARAVKNRDEIDLTMGEVNVIWQGDANEYALRSLALCQSPPEVLNVTGPELLSVRWTAERFGEYFGVRPVFRGQEAETALLSNASKAHRLFGYPKVTIRQMIEWVANWVEEGGPVYNKSTHFQEREGKF